MTQQVRNSELVELLTVDFHNKGENLVLSADCVIDLPILGGDPDPPPAGYFRLYAKAGGLYVQSELGAVTGPLS